MSRRPCDEVFSRRDLLKTSLSGMAMLVVARLDAFASGGASVTGASEGRWWGFLVDITRCIGCGACVRACRAENAVPKGYYRTWVERYTMMRDGAVRVDSPNGAEDGFPAAPPVDHAAIEKSFFVPKLCNQCATSPCVQVCPVGASFLSRDGVVLVDRKHCVGCGYCIQACPYGSRFLHPDGYADKCTLCLHRTTKGLPPACVQACPTEARLAGDLHDPNGALRRRLGQAAHGVLKADLGTNPKVYYVGLDQEVR